MRLVPDPTVITADQLLVLDEPGVCHELVRGQLKRMTPAGHWHGGVVGLLAARLGSHVFDRRLGVVYGAETGFLLAREPDTVLAPDAAFVVSDRVPAESAGFFVGAPDLAVEVVSPGDSARGVHEKAREWLLAGARVVWVVDPKARSVVIHGPGGRVRTLDSDDILHGGDLLPGFSLLVRDLFPA